MEELKVRITTKSSTTFLIELAGPLDASTVPDFRKKTERLLVPGTKFIGLDMRGVNYISSLGIGEIFKLRRFANANQARLAITNLQPAVDKVLKAVDALPPGVMFKSLEEMDAYLNSLQNEGGF